MYPAVWVPAVPGNSLARPASPTNPVCHPHPRMDVTIVGACMSSPRGAAVFLVSILPSSRSLSFWLFCGVVLFRFSFGFTKNGTLLGFRPRLPALLGNRGLFTSRPKATLKVGLCLVLAQRFNKRRRRIQLYCSCCTKRSPS
jgi:hypothetical protein